MSNNDQKVSAFSRRAFVGGAASSALFAGVAGRAAVRKPNIVIIMADDMGYGDLSSYGSRVIDTPNIDGMAAGGVKLTNFYACASICSPSRSGIMTGRYPIRNGVTNNFGPVRQPGGPIMPIISGIGLGMDTDEITLGQALKQKGYATACIGKWHLGDLKKHRPNHRGFDHYFGIPYSNDMEPVILWRNDEIAERPVNQDTLTRRYTEEAIQFMEQNRDNPFLLYFPHTFPHIPLHASDKFRGTSDGGLYGDTVEELDWSVGEVLSCLDRLGIAEDTFVFFTSDNGPWFQGSTGGQRDRKLSVFEGGFRVPAIARWPGMLDQGLVMDAPAMNIDLFTTSVNLAGGRLPSDRVIDGRDMMPLLRGGGPTHEALYYYWLDNLHAVRVGRWKYHRAHRFWTSYFFYAKKGPMLFDIENDPEESYNMIELYPEKAAELEEVMKEWESTLI